MAMVVLKTKGQIDEARQELAQMGASMLEPPWRALLRKARLVRGVKLGDMVKSWDVLATLRFLDRHVDKNAPVLDIGCFASEVLVALHRLGYKNLTGADMNPDLKKMPHQEAIQYEVTDFMRTPFPDASFQAVTSISVIEHGFDGDALLKEMSRLLRPGGYFIASFDYWPEKIDTSNTKFFGMDWKIFSKEEVAAFVSEAAAYGLAPVGEMSYAAQDRTIDCAERQYTFGWMVLAKSS